MINCTIKGGECDESKSRVVCGTDNQTYPTRCHLIRAQCNDDEHFCRIGKNHLAGFVQKSFVFINVGTQLLFFFWLCWGHVLRSIDTVEQQHNETINAIL